MSFASCFKMDCCIVLKSRIVNLNCVLLETKKMAMIIGIIFTAMVLAFFLATGLISYSVYIHKSRRHKLHIA